jgi:putative ABC transport system permease protein
LISLGAAAMGALRAVRRAVALPPAEAMRPEPPARFRAGFIERLGFQRLLSISVRVIIRNLERNPVKAALTAFGIAMSVSLLVVGFYFFDAVDLIIDLQFNQVFREDANVVFNEPRPSRARFDAMNLPGVMRVEAYRATPARVRFEHRSRRTALMGVEAEGQLHRIVDAEYRIFKIPPEGLVLTATLAESLGVKPGDEVTIEVLEGERPVRRVRVVNVVDEVLGLSAYMDRRALNRLMREGETISGVRLMVDERHFPALYSQLKRTPAVSGVLLPEATLRNFNETLARTMGTSTGVIVAFACIIVFGMVYNGARIALSERGRELASLRVLGFTKAEIGVMLLGEQAILTVIAIPAGWAIGYLLSFLIIRAVDTELMRLPLVMTSKTMALAAMVTACAAILSGLLVQWRLRRLDLVEVLKTRE